MDVLGKIAEAAFAKHEAELPDDEINPDDEDPPRLFDALHLNTISGEAVCQHLQLPSGKVAGFPEYRPPPNQQPLDENDDGGFDGNHNIKLVIIKASRNSIVQDTGKRLFRELVAALDLTMVLDFISAPYAYNMHTGHLNDENGISFYLKWNGLFGSFWTTRRVGTGFECRCVVFSVLKDYGFNKIMDVFAECKIECYSPVVLPFLFTSLLVDEFVRDSNHCNVSLTRIERVTGI